jgi:hypothetical protein
MQSVLFCFFSFLFIPISLGQSGDSLAFYGNKMLNERAESERLQAAHSFGSQLDFSVSTGVYLIEHPSYAIIYAPDKTFRIITWAVKRDDGTFAYFGRFQSLKKGSTLYQALTDARETMGNPAFSSGSYDKWYGCMYYSIVKYGRKKPVYVLLGWDGHTSLSNRKIIEVLQFDEPKVMFGKPIFYGIKKVQSRVIFEYMEDVAMSLRLDEGGNKIIFDHLAPIRSNLEGQFAFYAPDFTYDSFRYHKGRMIFERNIDARNKDENKGNPQKTGKKFPSQE